MRKGGCVRGWRFGRDCCLMCEVEQMLIDCERVSHADSTVFKTI